MDKTKLVFLYPRMHINTSQKEIDKTQTMFPKHRKAYEPKGDLHNTKHLFKGETEYPEL